MNPLLVTMRGPNDAIKLSEIPDFEAGVIALSEITRLYPGITWGQLASLPRTEKMSGFGSFMRSVGSGVMDVGRSTGGAAMDVVRGGGGVVMDVSRSAGDLVGDAFDATGSKIGDAVRLFTDEKVVGGVNQAWKGWTDGGGVAGFWGTSQMFGGNSGGTDEEEQNAAGGIWDFIKNLGAGTKKAAGNQASILGIPSEMLPWAIAGGALLVVLFARPGHK